MELYYLNSEREKLDFTKPPYAPRDISELLDYEWGYESEGSGITGFTKEIAELSLVINVFADDEETYLKACDRLFTITEKDVIKNAKGRLYYNGQYVLCNLIGSTKKDWCMGVDFHLCYMRLITDRSVWIKEKEYIFKYSNITSTNNKSYPLKYPYRYANGMKIVNVQNDAIDSAHFMLRFYGPAVNPMITIAGNPYTVHAVVEAGEYIEINSLKKTVIKKMITGTEVNLFHYKGKNLFRKILPGQHVVQCGNFDFDLILFEERSEPRWQSSE